MSTSPETDRLALMSALIPLWLGLSILSVIGLYISFRFRRGTMRSTLRQYRNPDRPAIIRNGSLVGVLSGALLLPMLVVIAPLVLLPVSLSRHTTFVIVLVFGGWWFLVQGTAWILAFRLPLWLVPQWLGEDDVTLDGMPDASIGSIASSLA